MNLEQEIQELKKINQRIDGKLTALLNKPAKQTWASVSFVTLLTGWSKEKMRQAREQNIITYRENKTGGYEYLLESIPTQFLKTA